MSIFSCQSFWYAFLLHWFWSLKFVYAVSKKRKLSTFSDSSDRVLKSQSSTVAVLSRKKHINLQTVRRTVWWNWKIKRWRWVRNQVLVAWIYMANAYLECLYLSISGSVISLGPNWFGAWTERLLTMHLSCVRCWYMHAYMLDFLSSFVKLQRWSSNEQIIDCLIPKEI